MPTQHYEKGVYSAKIINQRFGVTKTKTPYFALEFEPNKALGVNALPSEIYSRELKFFFSEKATPYSIEKLRQIGWTGDKLEDLDPTNAQYDSFKDIELEVICDYNEAGYEDWDLVGGSAAKEATPGVAAKLDRIYGKAIKASKPIGVETPTATPAAPVSEATTQVVEDNIPF